MPEREPIRKRMHSLDGTSFRFERKAHTLFVNDMQVRTITCDRDVVELITEHKTVRVSGATYWEMRCDDVAPTKLLAGTILARYDALVGQLQRIAAEKSQEQEL